MPTDCFGRRPRTLRAGISLAFLLAACSAPLEEARFERDLDQARRCFLNVTPNQEVPPLLEFSASIEPEAVGDFVAAPFVHDGANDRYRLYPPQPMVPGQPTLLQVRFEAAAEDAVDEPGRWSLLVLVYPRPEAEARFPSAFGESPSGGPLEYEGHCPPGFLYASRPTPVQVVSP